MNRNLWVVTALTLGLPTLLGATQGSFYLGAAGTGAQVDLTAAGGGKDDIAEGGASFGGQLLYDFSKSFAAGIDINHTKFGEKNSALLFAPFNSWTNLNSTVIMAVGKWTALPDSRVHPYLMGGLGMHNTAFKYEITPPAGYHWLPSNTIERRALVDSSQSALAGALGLGIDLDVSKSVFFGGEARLTYLGKVNWEATPLGQTAGIQSIEGANSIFQLLLRVGFKFGSGSSAGSISQTQAQSQPTEPAKKPEAPGVPGAI
jgi:opacity protein-like surface antigen